LNKKAARVEELYIAGLLVTYSRASTSKTLRILADMTHHLQELFAYTGGLLTLNGTSDHVTRSVILVNGNGNGFIPLTDRI